MNLPARSLLYAAVGVVGVVAALASGFERSERALDALEAEAERAVQTIGAVAASARDKMIVLSAQAQATLRRDAAASDPWLPMALGSLPGAPEVQVMRTRPGAMPMPLDVAVITLHGPPPEAGSLVGAEIRMALSMQDALLAAQTSTEGAAWVYYLSEAALQLVVPAPPMQTLTLDPRRLRQDVIRQAGRDRNPSRGAVWSEPYLDPFGKGLVCSVAAPVDDLSGQPRGVVGMDFTLDSLDALLQRRDVAGSQAMLIGGEDRLLAYPGVALSAEERTLGPADVAPSDAAAAVWAALPSIPVGPRREAGGYSVRVWQVPTVPWRYVLVTDLSALRWATLRRMGPEAAGLGLLAIALWVMERRRGSLVRLTRQQVLVDVYGSAPAPIVVLREHDAAVLQMNPALLDLFGVTAPTDSARLRVRAQLAALVPALAGVAEPPDSAPGAVIELEQRFERLDGGAFCALVRATRDHHAERPGWLCSLTDVTALQLARERLTEIATTDSLTAVLNRRGLEQRLRVELLRCERSELPLSVLMLDVDHFKRVNDSHGHDVGDLALAMLAATCHEAMRPTDLFGRWGGEEFVAVLPGTDPRAAHDVAERLRQRVAELDVPVSRADGSVRSSLRLTVSVGVATSLLDAPGAVRPGGSDLIAAADAALYLAKRGGRNRVVAA